MSENQIYNPFNPQGIATDADAESAVVWLRERAEERDRLIKISDEMILKYQAAQDRARESYARDTEVTMNNLATYASEHVTKETKTMRKTILATANLIWKTKSPKVEKDDNVLKSWIEGHAEMLNNTFNRGFIKREVLESVQWADLKGLLKELGSLYYFTTLDGEVFPVEGVTLIPQPEIFGIE